MSDAGAVFGDGSTAGFFNLGQYDPKLNYVNGKNYQLDGDPLKGRNAAWDYFTGFQGQPTPQMTAGQVGAAPQMTAASLGPASLAGGTMIDQTQADEARKYQMGLMGNLYDQSMGKGPSLAGAQLQAGADANLANMMSAQGSKGGMGALAGRQLAMQGAQVGQQTAQASALARIQEQMNAQQQLGGLSSGVRAQDLGVAGQQAQLDQATAFANMGAKNQFDLAQAGFNQQAAAANQGMAGQYGMLNANLQQGANQQNLGASMWGAENKGKWFDRYTGYMNSDRDARMRYAEDNAQVENNFNQSSQKAYESAGTNRSNFLSSFGGMMGMGIL